MKNVSLQPFPSPTQFIAGLSLLVVLTFVAFAVGSIDLTFSGWMALAVAALVSAFVGRFQIRLPKANGILSVPFLFAFWGLLWFGQAGGVILGVVSTILNIWPSRKTKNNVGFEAMWKATALTASVLLFSIFFETPVSEIHKAGGLSVTIGILIVSGALIFTSICLLMNVVFSTILCAADKGDGLKQLHARPREQGIDGIVVALSTILVCLPFSHFGIEFGFVIAPIVILANISYSIHIKRLDQKTRQISEASRVHLATVEALATAIDARDQVGLGHVQRTQIYAIGLGELLGLGESDVNALRTGALLHDIGKLAVPDHILNKPEKLTGAELEKTKIHSVVGASILEKIGFNYPVVPTVKYHHEAWDGTGYPERLKGEEIPLTARILAVADAYDTLRGARPYRPAIPRDLAKQIIQDEAGSRFDPVIVRCFIKNLASLEAEIDAYGLAYSAESEYGGHNYVEQIKLANREVFTLYELAREFSSSVNFQETLNLFAKKIGEFVPFTTCAIFLLDEEKKFASAIHVEGENCEHLTGRRIRVGDGETGSALEKEQAVRNNDLKGDLALFHLESTELYSTMVSVPLVADDGLIGAVSLYWNDSGGYAGEHLRLLETIARIAAEAIGKSLEHDEAKTNALTDPMTGLPNARNLQIQFDKEVARASRAGTTFQLLMLDLDGFKAVNDSFGHKAGDNLLREIGKVIREQLRDYDFLARYGGDEFVALIPDTSLEDVAELCTRIESGVCSYRLHVEDKNFASVGVSIGSASYPASGETFDQMIVMADKAMYRRKIRRRQDPSRFMISGIGLMEKDSGVTASATDKDGLIVELDESHVVASTAVN